MEKDSKFYKRVAKELYEVMCVTKDTSVTVEAKKDQVEILPSNKNVSGAFYYLNELVDYCRFRRLSYFIDVHEGKVRVVVF